MTLAGARELVAAATAARTAQLAFNVVHLETAEAIVTGAERAGRPVVLQISHNCVRFHGGLRPISLATLALAEQAAVPIAVHLDHAETAELAYAAVDLGYQSVMYDGAALPYAENVAATRDVVAYAHARGVAVEAELGVIGGKGAHAPGVRTEPDEAARFAAETGVDALAVAVGSEHAMTQRTAGVDLELINRIAERVAVPLVLHGGSGVPDADLVAAGRAGMAKINISTHLNAQFTRAVRDKLAADPALVDSRRYLAPGRDAVAAEVARLLTLFAPAA